MKMEAGLELYHRKPKQATAAHAAMMVKRIGHRIGEAWMVRTLEVVELPERDDRIADEGDHRGAGGQAVKTVGQIDGVGPCGHQEIHPDHEQHDGHDTTGEFKAEERLFDEAHAGLGAGEAGFGRQNQRQHRVYGGEDELSDELALDGQSLALFLADLREIVDESQESHRQHGEQHQDRGPRRHLSPGEEPIQCRGAPAEHHREVDDHAAKRRRAALDEMRLRAILTDVLSVIELVHQLNQQRSAHNRHDERHHNADDE